MRGTSHVAINMASAAVVNTLAIHLPIHISGEGLSRSRLIIDLFTQAGWLHLIQPGVLTSPQLLQKLVFYGLMALGALLPDIDHPASLLGRRVKFISHFLHHRTLTHSLFGVGIALVSCLLAGGLCWIGLSLAGVLVTAGNVREFVILLCVLTLGCLLHQVEDSCTVAGVSWLWPFSRARYGGRWFRTGSIQEYLLVAGVLLVVALAWWLQVLVL